MRDEVLNACRDMSNSLWWSEGSTQDERRKTGADRDAEADEATQLKSENFILQRANIK